MDTHQNDQRHSDVCPGTVPCVVFRIGGGLKVINKKGGEIMMVHLSAVALGILSSLVSWWVLTHLMCPKLSFSQNIICASLTEHGPKEKFCHMVKFKNIKGRSIIDLDVHAYINIKAKGKNMPDEGRNFYIELSVSRIPKLEGHTTTGVTFHPEIKYELVEGNATRQLKPQKNGMKLEDIIVSPDFNFLRLIVYGYDEFSGSRKLFESPQYRSKCFEALGDFQPSGPNDRI